MNTGNSHGHLNGLDHLRALAIILVFFCHYNLDIFGHPKWMSHAHSGWTGVDLFFVLSGFLISSQVFASIKAGNGVDYKSFFLKRFFRIIPAFCAVAAIYYIFPQFREEETLPPACRLLTFTHNLGLDVFKYGAFSHSWSLCVEEHFYIALPLALIVLVRLNLLRLGPWMIGILFISGFAIREYCWRHLYSPLTDSRASIAAWYEHIYYPTYCRLDGLLIGVSIAAVYVFAPGMWQRISKYGNVFLLSSIAVLGFALLKFADPSHLTGTFGFPLIDLAYGALVISALSPNTFLYKIKFKISTLIATLSYGIYLLHKGAIHITQLVAAQIGLNTNSVVVLLLCMASCILLAATLYLAIEQPFMKMRRWLLRGDRRERVKVVMD